MRPFQLIGLACLALFTLSACSTIVNSGPQDITIASYPASGAECEVTVESTRYEGQTPGRLLLDHGPAPLLLRCSRDGFEDLQETIYPSFNGATIGNVIAGGLVGVAVDAASGANYSYPDSITLQMIALRDVEIQLSDGKTLTITREQTLEASMVAARLKDDSRFMENVSRYNEEKRLVRAERGGWTEPNAYGVGKITGTKVLYLVNNLALVQVDVVVGSKRPGPGSMLLAVHLDGAEPKAVAHGEEAVSAMADYVGVESRDLAAFAAVDTRSAALWPVSGYAQTASLAPVASTPSTQTGPAAERGDWKPEMLNGEESVTYLPLDPEMAQQIRAYVSGNERAFTAEVKRYNEAKKLASEAWSGSYRVSTVLEAEIVGEKDGAVVMNVMFVVGSRSGNNSVTTRYLFDCHWQNGKLVIVGHQKA